MLDDLAGDGAVDATRIVTPRGTLEEEHAPEALSQIPCLILEGKNLEALALCHETERSLEISGASATLKSKIIELRRFIERDLLVRDIALVCPKTRLHPIASNNILIGRPSSTRSVDIAINCRWFSRGERGLHLICDNDVWSIEDLGSTNGSYIAEQQLARGALYTLSSGMTTIEIGRTQDRLAPVVLQLNRIARHAVIVSVSVGAGFDSRSASESWPSLHGDLRKRWLVFVGQLTIGSDEAGAIDFHPRVSLG